MAVNEYTEVRCRAAGLYSMKHFLHSNLSDARVGSVAQAHHSARPIDGRRIDSRLEAVNEPKLIEARLALPIQTDAILDVVEFGTTDCIAAASVDAVPTIVINCPARHIAHAYGKDRCTAAGTAPTAGDSIDDR